MESNLPKCPQEVAHVMNKLDSTYPIPWNLLQIICGSIIAAIDLKGIALPHRFISG
jgi:hypothetical protein